MTLLIMNQYKKHFLYFYLLHFLSNSNQANQTKSNKTKPNKTIAYIRLCLFGFDNLLCSRRLCWSN